jgi:hypothetical protein
MRTTSDRTRYALWALGSLIPGAALVLYEGPGRAWVRGWLGDFLAVIFLYAVLGVIWDRGWRWRLGLALAVAFGLEAAQWLRLIPPEAPAWLRFVAGTYFDPWDLAAYAGGGLWILVWERHADLRYGG